MKKTLMTLAAVLCCAMMTTVVTACGDDEGNTKYAADVTPAAEKMDYILTTSDEMLNTLNLTVEYYDANGSIQSEQMTQTEWKKTVRAKLPATHGLRLKMQVKNGVDVKSIATFRAMVNFLASYDTMNSGDGVVVKGTTITKQFTLDMPGGSIPYWVEQHANGIVSILYTFDMEGKETKGTWQ